MKININKNIYMKKRNNRYFINILKLEIYNVISSR